MSWFSDVFVVFLPGLTGLIFAYLLYRNVKKQPAGSETMRDIAENIHRGAMTFLKAEYGKLGIFALLIALLLLFCFSWKTGLAFLLGGSCSALAGFIGMKAATRGNVRTAEAARARGMGQALLIAFNGGAVMGLAVASLGLLGLGGLYITFTQSGVFSLEGAVNNLSVLNILFGFSMGASSIALFARIAGGIFTKAADVGSDLVGKVEAGIPEDDPRNPGVIADNVGDNVADEGD